MDFLLVGVVFQQVGGIHGDVGAHFVEVVGILVLRVVLAIRKRERDLVDVVTDEVDFAGEGKGLSANTPRVAIDADVLLASDLELDRLLLREDKIELLGLDL